MFQVPYQSENSTGNAKLLTSGAPWKELAVTRCLVCHSMWLLIDASHKQTPLAADVCRVVDSLGFVI